MLRFHGYALARLLHRHLQVDCTEAFVSVNFVQFDHLPCFMVLEHQVVDILIVLNHQGPWESPVVIIVAVGRHRSLGTVRDLCRRLVVHLADGLCVVGLTGSRLVEPAGCPCKPHGRHAHEGIDQRGKGCFAWGLGAHFGGSGMLRA